MVYGLDHTRILKAMAGPLPETTTTKVLWAVMECRWRSIPEILISYIPVFSLEIILE